MYIFKIFEIFEIFEFFEIYEIFEIFEIFEFFGKNDAIFYYIESVRVISDFYDFNIVTSFDFKICILSKCYIWKFLLVYQTIKSG